MRVSESKSLGVSHLTLQRARVVVALGFRPEHAADIRLLITMNLIVFSAQFPGLNLASHVSSFSILQSFVIEWLTELPPQIGINNSSAANANKMP